MVKCKKCGKDIQSGEIIIIQFDGLMLYNGNEPTPEKFTSLLKYWHAGCKAKNGHKRSKRDMGGKGRGRQVTITEKRRGALAFWSPNKPRIGEDVSVNERVDGE